MISYNFLPTMCGEWKAFEGPLLLVLTIYFKERVSSQLKIVEACNFWILFYI
jgi:hypothetical protein